jgi:oxygen-independent coproporphyrinogen III oxidase
MAGLYLHIPFCRKACHYCNFHFSTSLKSMPELVQAICKELEMEKNYLGGKTIETIYFGGGTPSLLDAASLDLIFETIAKHYQVLPAAEVTLEANPDDLTREKLAYLRTTPINRLSIGIQTLHEPSLIWMNRTHNAIEARTSVEWALEAGFEALSLDLIYGIPGHDLGLWEKDLQQILDWRPEHMSCYALTVEEKTALHHQVQKGKQPVAPEEDVTAQFDLLLDMTEAAGYEHYEISNFSLPGKAAKHNSNYWFGAEYIGIGPSAHGHRKGERRWNIAQNAVYMRGIEANTPERETEVLTKEQEFNEFILTRLRTSQGISIEDLSQFKTKFVEVFRAAAQNNVAKNLLFEPEKGRFALTRSGKKLADAIILDFICL